MPTASEPLIGPRKAALLEELAQLEQSVKAALLEELAQLEQSVVGLERQHEECICNRASDELHAKLMDRVLENLTGVEAKWLAGVRPFFEQLLAKAEDPNLSSADFARALEKAARQMPELFDKLDSDHLAQAFEEAMSTSLVNGAVRGYMDRRRPRARRVRSRLL
jgi:hypothetical protein